jgi:anti-sigma factor RsiW
VLIIEINCRAVWKLISSFIDGELDSELRRQLEEHLQKCSHCAALLQGTQNVIRLIADEQAFDLPSGFSERLRKNLDKIAR